LNKLGKLTTGRVNTYEVHPGLDPDDTYRRLIDVDGTPRNHTELENEDRKHQKHVLDDMNRRTRNARIHLCCCRATMVDGHSTVVVDFKPRPGVAPRTDDGKDLKKVKGRAWIASEKLRRAIPRAFQLR
jgi:hypothetical protein